MSPNAPTEETSVDAEELLAGLKPFQRATVEHAFRRLWTDEDPSPLPRRRRGGLGKTSSPRASPPARSRICARPPIAR